MRFQHGERLGEAWTVRVAFDKPGLVGDGGVDAHAHAVQVHLNQLHLLMHVRHDFLRCVGRRGGPEVGHQIQQGPIVLMPDGGNQGSVGRRRGAHHVLIGKANQIFESAAATRHDDHIHIWIGIQLPDGRYHVRRALLALHVHMRHLEADDGPTQTHVGDDVAFRTCLRRADQADAMRKFRQRLLAIGVEQTFSLKLLA